MSASVTPEPLPLQPVLVLSPHLDDGVFACGRLLASVRDATVATVFAGHPAPGAALTEWDRAAGFRAGGDPVAARREEDRQALAVLGARPCWLDFRDSQYGPPPEAGALAEALGRLLDAHPGAMVVFPLGLFHSDHRLLSDAALDVLPRHPERSWVAYEDTFYRRLPGLVEERVANLRDAGLAPRAVAFAEEEGAAALKAAAVACYGSQLLALASPGRPGHGDLTAAEAYWRVAGPEGEGVEVAP